MQIALEFGLDIIKRLEVKEGDWIVEGFAGTTDLDLQGDIITPEAWKNAERDLIGTTLLFNHDENQPLGQVIDVKATEEGLWIKSRISKTNPERWQQILDDTINKYSVRGFVIDVHKEYIHDEGRIANVINEMKLIEASMVTVPGNPQAEKIRAYIQKALRAFEKNGGKIPFKLEREGGEKRMDLSFLAEEDFLDVEKILTGLIEKETDPEKSEALKLLMEKAKKRKKEEEYPYPYPKKKSEESYEEYGKRMEEFFEKRKKEYPYPRPERKKDESLEDFGKRIEAGVLAIAEKAWVWVDKETKEEIEKAKKKKKEGEKEYPYPKKESYTQEDVDEIIKQVEQALEAKYKDILSKQEEEEEKLKEKDKLLEESLEKIKNLENSLKDMKADKEVEEKWSSLKEDFEEKDAAAIKKILKKSILGEVLSAEETLQLIQKKKTGGLKVGSEFIKSVEEAEKEKLIEEFGIKVRAKG